MSVDARMKYNKLKHEQDLFRQEETKELLANLKKAVVNHVVENDWKGYDLELIVIKKDIKLAINTLKSGLIFIKTKKIELEGKTSLLLTSEGYMSTIESIFMDFVEEIRKSKKFEQIIYYDITQETLYELG